MGLFYQTRALATEEDLHQLVSILPGFQGLPSNVTAEFEAVKNSDIFTATMMIASDLAKMRIQVVEEGVRKKADPLENLLNVRPNLTYNSYIFKLTVFANALLTKHGYVEIVRDPGGRPIELYHLKTSEMELKQRADNTLYYIHTRRDASGKETKRNLEFEDVIDFKMYSLNGTDGLSLLESLGEDLDAQKYSKKFFANFFRNGTQSGGLLRMKGAKLSREAREKIRDEWQRANTGQASAGKVLVLDETMDYSQLEVDTDILKLITNNTYGTSQIAKVFGIPLHRFGIETMNMSIEQSNLDYLHNTLSTYMEAVVAELNFKLIPPDDDGERSFRFDTETFKAVDSETQIKNIGTELDKGIINLDEARRKLGYPPLPDGMGQKYRVSLNNVSIDIADDYQLSKARDKRRTSTEGGEENA